MMGLKLAEKRNFSRALFTCAHNVRRVLMYFLLGCAHANPVINNKKTFNAYSPGEAPVVYIEKVKPLNNMI